MDSVDDLVDASRNAGVAELCWSDPQGSPRATAIVPLEHEGRPALALHWSQWPAVRELAASPGVAWVLSDRRLAQRDWQPGVGLGRVRLVVDQDGSVFTDSMLDQELRKHPPSRAFADSHVLRREHWWFLPRLILVLEPTAVHGIGERTDADLQGVLAVGSGGGDLSVDTVALDPASVNAVLDTPVTCTSLGRRPAQRPGAAVLLRHDFSVPDLERWGRAVTSGRWDRAGLRAVERPVAVTAPTLPPAPGLRHRLRRHRELERECRRALRAAAT
ncbi:MAG: pyridoxamine 5'-phosphate oxidase family protein [Actinomycetota bacterium]|nr:pyridoxamine 5'-phosphate oxidase family protein [Actinomycetota bacterium]